MNIHKENSESGEGESGKASFFSLAALAVLFVKNSASKSRFFKAALE
jgi:hypothetical protein